MLYAVGDYYSKYMFNLTLLTRSTHDHSGQNVAQQILTIAMMRITVNKSTDKAKPHFDLFFTTIAMSKKMFFSECKLNRALCDTLM